MTPDEQRLELGAMAAEKSALIGEEECLVNRLRKMASASKAVYETLERVVSTRPLAPSPYDPDWRVEDDTVQVRTWGNYETLFSPHEFNDNLQRLVDVRRRLKELTETLGF